MAPPWQAAPAWRVLDTGFGDGAAFIATWQAWAADGARPGLLHYVAITASAPALQALLSRLEACPALAGEACVLRRQWFGLLPGVHRMVLHGGQVLLTLCIGPLHAMLREQQFLADTVWLGGAAPPPAPDPWDRWSIHALARLCRRGTGLVAPALSAALREALVSAGFVLDAASSPSSPSAPPSPDAGHSAAAAPPTGVHGAYLPRWEPRVTRAAWRASPLAVSRCVVVGAGLAGATVAAALAHRGWQVTVLDAAEAPAAGASGLPVGLLVPAVSRDDNLRSRLSRSGVRLTLQACASLLHEGEDWCRSGVLEMRPDGTPALPAGWPAAGREWSDEAPPPGQPGTWAAPPGHAAGALWHKHAGWVRPARLVQACLAQPGVVFQGGSAVHSAKHEGGQWLLRDAAGRLLAQAPQLVVANAGDAVRLVNSIAAQPGAGGIEGLAPMPRLAGQVSWATHSDAEEAVFPPFPVNGRGSLVAHIPTHGTRAWYAGATYEAEPPADGAQQAAHQQNHQRLGQLLPAVAAVLGAAFAGGHVHAWRGVRCTTTDHLPAAGRLFPGGPPGLWISAAMGSRGLTYAVLCAETIAAQLGAEPLPMEAGALKALDPGRPRLAAGRPALD